MRGLGMFVLIIGLFVLWDVGWWIGGHVPPRSPWTLKEQVRDGNLPTIVDVRTPSEYEAFHIPGAFNIPYPASIEEVKRIAPDPNEPVVVVCMSGHRSPPVAHKLVKDGYTNVSNLTWGMLAWKVFGGETISGRR
ncbi:Rhodanese domain protein [Pseudodesulfovibrio profundus]|uniref:Rhodanese domain protein n=1 Tax=Pseudodesulfovibrio profundus TaxID=57320 RepID=A0A2C8F7X6_9BACT|nr:rhodanese-like domain-containing protein [Pseudodesulfovibrio profundus]SOB58548.1 Rhodanese domain protein [Pseudodesulfovibrio profundus]